MRRRVLGQKDKTLFEKRFYPAGNYTWTVPPGCTEVDVFLVGGGSSGDACSGGGGGYTKTFKKATTGWRDDSAVSVTPGQSISIVVGTGGKYGGGQNTSKDGGYSQFLNYSYRALGGISPSSKGHWAYGGNGGSGGGAESASVIGNGGSDGGNGAGDSHSFGVGQGHTTRDFGEATGKRNAGGGAASNAYTGVGKGAAGKSDYTEGKGLGEQGGGGYGGGGYSQYPGGDGVVLIRYYAYEE